MKLILRIQEALHKAQLSLFPGMVLKPSAKDPTKQRWQQTQQEQPAPKPAAKPAKPTARPSATNTPEPVPPAPAPHVEAYLQGTIRFGEETVTRAEAVQRLHQAGSNPDQIEAFLAEADRPKAIPASETAPKPEEKPPEQPTAAAPVEAPQPATEETPVLKPDHDWAVAPSDLANTPLSEVLAAAPAFGVPIGKGTQWRIATNEKAAALLNKPKEQLTDEDLVTLRAYSGDGRQGDGHINAYYTSPEVASFMWKVVSRLGFRGGKVLEPSCGNGIFLHYAPQGCLTTGVEISPVSAGIAERIHPNTAVNTMPFEQFNTSEPAATRFDLVIGNPPFTVRDTLRGMDKSHIKRYDQYFMSAGLDRTKPGGLLAYVEPVGVMGIANHHFSGFRARMTSKAQVIAAYRLPSKAFGRQGTEQTCDVIVMRKLPDDVALARRKMTQEELEASWSEAEKSWVHGGYFHDHPEAVLGAYNPEKAFRGVYVEGDATPERFDHASRLPLTETTAPSLAETLAVVADEERRAAIDKWVKKQLAQQSDAEETHRVGDVKSENGILYRLNENHRWERIEDAGASLCRDFDIDPHSSNGEILKALSEKVHGGERLTPAQLTLASFVCAPHPDPDSLDEAIRSGARLATEAKTPEQADKIAAASLLGWRCRQLQVLQTQKSEEAQVKADALRVRLLKDLGDYDAEFTAARADNGLCALAGRSRSLAALVGAYKDDGSPADYILHRTYYSGTGEAPSDPTNLGSVAAWLAMRTETFTAADVARLWKGGDESAAMEQMLHDPALAIAGLEAGAVQWQPVARYATGKLKAKVDAARELVENLAQGVTSLPEEVREAVSAKLSDQAQLLDDLMPRRSIEDIQFNPRSAFIPVEALADWVNAPNEKGEHESHMEYRFERDASGAVHAFGRKRGGYTWEETDNVWGGYEKGKLMNYLNRFRMKSDDAEHFKSMEQNFKNWIAESPKWRQAVEDAYNEAYADSVEADYSTAEMEIPGIVKELADKNGQVKPFRAHGVQFRTVRHMLDKGAGIISLDVGVGKTLTGLMMLQKGRAEGRWRKPVVVCPKSMVPGWLRACKKYFPGLDPKRVLVVSGLGAEREKQLQDAANNDWDLVIMSRDTFGMIPIRQETQDRYIQDDFWVSRSNIMGSSRQGKSVKAKDAKEARQIEKTQKQAEKDENAFKGERAARLDKKKGMLYWEDMGFDCILADEAHAYKNLESPQTAERQGVKYLPAGSDGARRSIDFAYKSRFIREKNGGKNVFGLSATPTPNSAVEIYTMIGYVAPEEWKKRGVMNVEDFIDRFCQIAPRTVITTDGSFAEKQALVGFQNLRELRSLYRQFVTHATAQESGIRVPKGNEVQHMVDMPPETARVYEPLRARAKELQHSHGRSDDGDHIFSVMSEMEKAALSLPLYYAGDQSGKTDTMPKAYQALYGAAAETLYHSPKMDECVLNARKSYDENASLKGGQLIFCDKIELHEEMKKRLMLAGVPENQIAIVNANATPSGDARLKVADRFNAGEVRFVIGNTDTMGEGMSFQKRCTDIHHLDYRWNQAGIHQRNGRGVRQGNPLDEVRVHKYMMKGSFDAYRIGITDGKRTWQEQILHGNSDSAAFEDQEELTGDQLQIALSDNPEEAAKALAAQRQTQKAAIATHQKEKAYETYNRLFHLRDRLKRAKTDEMRLKLEHDEKLLVEQLQKNPHFEHKDFLRTNEALVRLPGGMVLTKGSYIQVDQKGQPTLVKITEVDPLRNRVSLERPLELPGQKFSSSWADVPDLAKAQPSHVEPTAENVMRARIHKIGRYADLFGFKGSERTQYAGELETRLKMANCGLFTQKDDGVEWTEAYRRKESDKVVMPSKSNYRDLLAALGPDNRYDYDKGSVRDQLRLLVDAQQEEAA